MAVTPLQGVGIGAGALGGMGLLAALLGGHYRGPSAGFLQQNFGPGQLGMDTQALYSMLLASPAFSQQLQQANLAGQQFTNRLQAGLGSRGLQSSGVGTVASSLAPTVGTQLRQQAYAGLHQSAFDAALRNLMGRLQAFAQTRNPGPSQADVFGNLLGGGLSGLGQMLALHSLRGAPAPNTGG